MCHHKEGVGLMGLFNSIFIPCPQCDSRVEFQTKSGTKELIDFSISNVPAQELKGILGDVKVCNNCGHTVKIKKQRKDFECVDGSNLVN